jgi:uncharacterized integral membrane protein
VVDQRRDREHQPATDQRSIMSQVRLWGGIACAVLLVIFLVQNLEDANVEFLFWNLEMPLIFALIGAAALGAVAVQVFGYLRRRAKDEEQRERAAASREKAEKR